MDVQRTPGWNGDDASKEDPMKVEEYLARFALVLGILVPWLISMLAAKRLVTGMLDAPHTISAMLLGTTVVLLGLSLAVYALWSLCRLRGDDRPDESTQLASATRASYVAVAIVASGLLMVLLSLLMSVPVKT